MVKMFARPRREPMVDFLKRAGAMVERYLAPPISPVHTPTGGYPQKFGKKVEVAHMGGLRKTQPITANKKSLTAKAYFNNKIGR
jgi:hypothetical protein